MNLKKPNIKIRGMLVSNYLQIDSYDVRNWLEVNAPKKVIKDFEEKIEKLTELCRKSSIWKENENGTIAWTMNVNAKD